MLHCPIRSLLKGHCPINTIWTSLLSLQYCVQIIQIYWIRSKGFWMDIVLRTHWNMNTEKHCSPVSNAFGIPSVATYRLLWRTVRASIRTRVTKLLSANYINGVPRFASCHENISYWWDTECQCSSLLKWNFYKSNLSTEKHMSLSVQKICIYAYHNHVRVVAQLT